MAKTSNPKKDESKPATKAVASRVGKKTLAEPEDSPPHPAKSPAKAAAKSSKSASKSSAKTATKEPKAGRKSGGRKRAAAEDKQEEVPSFMKKNVKTKAETVGDLSSARFDIPLKFKKTEVPEFELPKFKTTSSIPYKPDYGSSILNQPKEEKAEPITYHRYSDAELEEFREILQSKLNETKSELLIVQKQLLQGGRDLERTHSMMEDGQMNAELEQLTQIARRYAVFIDNLEKALIRVENKTYGVCRATGKLIEKERLRVVPHATLSLEAKMKLAKNKNH